MKKLEHQPTEQDIALAHEAIKAYIHRTPVMTCHSINQILGCEIHFKCENLQKIGAFKMRGGSCAVAALTPEEKARGIATHSSGNHAQAIALAAKLHGIDAHIVMPEDAPAIKVAAVRGYGAKIYFCQPSIEDRTRRLKEVTAETGATFIHPFNHWNIIAGQATAAKELLAEVPDLEVVMAPVGGGGLLSGTALTCAYADRGIKVIGVEPEAVDDAYRSYQSGQIETNVTIDTIADGLRTTLGDKTLAVIRKYVDEILLVSEASIVEAMRLIWERMKIIVEPSGAVPLAAIVSDPDRFAGQKIGIILSGGNVDVEKLPF